MLELLLLASLSGVTTLIGCLIAFYIKKRKTVVPVGIGFSAGIMIAISFLELIVESSQMISELFVMLAFSFGFLVLMFFDILLPHMHFIKEKGSMKSFVRIGYLVAIGIILHDFPEGFAMASSYFLNRSLGILVALAIAIHNIPEEFALALPLDIAKKKKLLVKLGIASALAEPLGAIVGIFAISIFPQLIPFFMAFAAGAMVFISIDEFVPLAGKFKEGHYFAVGLLLGILTYVLLSMIV
jgi:ZIP family zinc transporter